MTDTQSSRSYELKIKILGNEVFYISLATSDDSNRWIAISLVTIFAFLLIAGAYGEKFVGLYKYIVH